MFNCHLLKSVVTCPVQKRCEQKNNKLPDCPSNVKLIECILCKPVITACKLSGLGKPATAQRYKPPVERYLQFSPSDQFSFWISLRFNKK